MSNTPMTLFASALLIAVLSLPVTCLLLHSRNKTSAKSLKAFLGTIASVLERINAATGSIVSWFTLAMVLIQTIVVIQRYVFGVNFIWMQESITYLHGMLFMLAAGYTLLRDGHVRVDVFYREASDRRKAMVDLTGTYLFLIPVLIVIWLAALPYVEIAWTMKEGSTETSGIQAIYLLKAVILVFVGLLLMQAYALAIRSAETLMAPDAGALPQSAAMPNS